MATNVGPDPAEPDRVSPVPELSGPARPPRLSEDLARLVTEFTTEAVTLREVMAVLRGRGTLVLALLLALPFCVPVPLPGLSTPFGLVIAWIAFRLALGQRPWLPAKLLDLSLSPRLFRRIFAAARRLLRGFEYLSRPRVSWIVRSRRLQRLHAVPVFLAAVLLLLPLPIPFSNFVPAFTILIFCTGLIERDGLFIIAGYICFLLTVIFFGIIFFAGAAGLALLREWLGARFT